MRKISRLLILGALAVLVFAQCSGSKTAKFTFDGSKEMSGTKFALKDINPDLPDNWDEYNYVVLEYKISTAQRFQLGFTTDWGYNELRIMSYVPNAWNKLAIPLKFYTRLPDPKHDLAALNNQPRYTGWINLGGERGPMHGVDSIGVRMRKAIGKPTIEIRNVTLSVEDPGDEYMGDKPAVDEFGQHNLVDYPEKVHSLAELQAQWAEEDAEEVTTEAYNYSKYGGYKQKQVKGTGFFRTEEIDGKWWFVDPEGYVFLSVGVDCVSAGGGGNVRDADKREGMYEVLPPAEIMDQVMEKMFSDRRPPRGGMAPGQGRRQMLSYGLWNQYRRYGDDFSEKSKDLIFKRMDKWGLNTIANWSSADVMKKNRKAFLVPLGDLRLDSGLMGLCDVYAPDFLSAIEESISRVTRQYVGNPWLIGYFIGNEPAWLYQEVRVCDLILEGGDRPIKAELQKYLKKHGDSEASRKAFVHDTFRIFLTQTNKVLKKCDPDHLNLGIRFGDFTDIDDDLLVMCGENFDVLSFNCYDLEPSQSMMDRAHRLTNLPMIIGEYHFGTVDRGLAQSLWQVESQYQRGVGYSYYTENAYSNPALIGTGYFQWADQDLTGRGDGENYNCGLVDVTDRPYKELTEAIMKTSARLYDIHTGAIAPTSQKPENARGHGQVPDLWNE